MLRDFDTNKNLIFSIESVSSMAIMLGEDPAIACESDGNAEGVIARFRARVSAIVTKIKEFIQKVIAWIKGKFLNLLELDSITIDEELWLNTSNAIKELDSKVKLGTMDMINLSIFASMHKTITFNDETEKTVNKIKTAASNIKEKLDEVVSGKYYTNAIDRKTNGKKVTIGTSSIGNLKQKFAKDLEILNTASKEAESIIKDLNPNAFANYSKALSAYMEITNVKIESLTKAMTLVNILITSGERKNEKDKNTTKIS